MAVLFCPGLQVVVAKIIKDVNGRFVLIDIEIEGKRFAIVNVYAPNEDKPEFFLDLFSEMSKMQAADKIIVGDFNLVLDEKKDSCCRKKNNDKSRDVI